MSYAAVTEGIKLDYGCEIVPVKNGTMVDIRWRSIRGIFYVIDVETPDCNITGATVAAALGHGFVRTEDATQNYQGQFNFYPCNADYNFAGSLPRDPKTEDMLLDPTADHRLLIYVNDLRLTPFARKISLWLNELAVVLCDPSYSLGQIEVQSSRMANGSVQTVLSPVDPKSENQLENLPPGGLA